MKITKYIIGLGIMAGTVISLPSCTDLSETVYDDSFFDIVVADNYRYFSNGRRRCNVFDICFLSF